MARIYTKSGDDGTTGLIGGARVPKDAARIEAYGTVDELNAVLGMVRSQPLPPSVDETLQRIQDDLFTLGANLALPDGADPADWKIPQTADADIERLEQEIDRRQAELPALSRFILPGGTPGGASLHLARTVSRRAERRCVSLAHIESVDPRILRYLNRLSDLCFVLARLVNQAAGCPEHSPNFDRG